MQMITRTLYALIGLVWYSFKHSLKVGHFQTSSLKFELKVLLRMKLDAYIHSTQSKSWPFSNIITEI